MIKRPFTAWLPVGLSILSAAFIEGSAVLATVVPNPGAAWERSGDRIHLNIPISGVLTDKQRSMIEGGFTTVSQLAVLHVTESSPKVETLLWGINCTVKFDAWDESYEVTRFQTLPNDLKSETMIFHKFSDYGTFCLTAHIPQSDFLTHVANTGERLVGRLHVQQISLEEGARIKEWLVRQQSGLMQSLFKHMLGELSLYQTLTVSISLPSFPGGLSLKAHDRESPSPRSRGP